MTQERSKIENATRRKAIKTIGAASIAGLAGCSGDEGGTTDDSGSGGTTGDPGSGDWPDLSGQRVNIVTQSSTDEFQDWWERAAADFEAATGARVSMEYRGFGGDYRSRIAQLLQAGNPPELASAGVTEVSTWAAQGVIGDLTPAIESIEDRWGEFQPNQTVVTDGSHRLVPQWLNGSGNYFYREDIFPRRPENWQDQIDIYNEVDEMAAEYIPQQQGNSFCPRAGMVAAAYTNGARMCERDENGEVQIVMDEGEMRERWIETIEHKVALEEAGAQIDQSGDCGNAVQSIPDEVAASCLYGGMRPKIQTVLQTDHGDQVRPMKMPGPEDGTGQIMATIQGLTTFEDANAEAANEFVDFLSQEEYLIDMYLQTPIHNAPLQEDVAEHPDYQEGIADMDGWTEEDKQYHLDLAQDAESWITFPGETDPPNPHAFNLFGADGLWRLVHDPVHAGTTPAETLDNVADNLREVLEESKEQVL